MPNNPEMAESPVGAIVATRRLSTCGMSGGTTSPHHSPLAQYFTHGLVRFRYVEPLWIELAPAPELEIPSLRYLVRVGPEEHTQELDVSRRTTDILGGQQREPSAQVATLGVGFSDTSFPNVMRWRRSS